MNKTELKKKTCPICGLPSKYNYRPFCSDRCSNIDLSRWLGETYAVPVVQLEETGELKLDKLIQDNSILS